MVESGPKKFRKTRRKLASRLRASDDQKKKVGIFAKTRLGPVEAPKEHKCYLLGRIGPRKGLQTRRKLPSRLRASDDQKGKSVFSRKRDWGPWWHPESLNVTCLVESGPEKVCRLAASWRVDCAHQMTKKKKSVFSQKRGWGTWRGPQGLNVTCLVESYRKKFCRFAESWRVDSAHQMTKKI